MATGFWPDTNLQKVLDDKVKARSHERQRKNDWDRSRNLKRIAVNLARAGLI
jgi:hypothetical protein